MFVGVSIGVFDNHDVGHSRQFLRSWPEKVIAILNVVFGRENLEKGEAIEGDMHEWRRQKVKSWLPNVFSDGNDGAVGGHKDWIVKSEQMPRAFEKLL